MTSISWPDVEGAVGYEVEIADKNYKPVMTEEVKTGKIQFSLPPGEYRVRIGVLNKFYKIENYSDWAVLKVAGPEERRKIKEEREKRERVLFTNSIKIGVGIPYFQVLPEYDQMFNNSFMGATFCLGGRIGTLLPFFHWGVLQYTGLELEGTYIKLEGREIPNRIKTNKIDIITGGNFYIATNFTFPLNLVVRGGGGFLQTQFEYDQSYSEDLKNYGDKAFVSIDYYYKAGLSLEYSFLKYMFMEAGADYYIYKYISTDFKVIRYYFMIGLML